MFNLRSLLDGIRVVISLVVKIICQRNKIVVFGCTGRKKDKEKMKKNRKRSSANRQCAICRHSNCMCLPWHWNFSAKYSNFNFNIQLKGTTQSISGHFLLQFAQLNNSRSTLKVSIEIEIACYRLLHCVTNRAR